MPIYDFICQSCGSEFEKLVSFSNQNAVICPTCQSTEVERQMGLPAIHFKGSGWYITDSKSTNTSSQPADTNGSSSSSSTESESTGDASSTAKSESNESSSTSSKAESSKTESSSKTASSASTDSGTKKTATSA